MRAMYGKVLVSGCLIFFVFVFVVIDDVSTVCSETSKQDIPFF